MADGEGITSRGGASEEPRQARATQPHRRFTPADLAALPPEQRRKLVQILVTERGSQVLEVQTPAAYDELVLHVTPLWHARRIRVRIAKRSVRQPDIDRLAEAIAARGDGEGLYLAPLGYDDGVVLPSEIGLVGPDELIGRLDRSPSIAWSERSPVPAYDRVASQRDLERDAALLDPVGLRWLPALALNELPPELAQRDIPPQDLLERMAFRLLTASFRFGGVRYGEAERGKRLPDALLTWPAGSRDRLAAMLDCKASADGYRMESDHLLRFVGYEAALRETVETQGLELRYLVVLSSGFQGQPGNKHPFHGRAREIRETAGLELVYVRAVDLARAATAVEAQHLSPGQRETLDWPRLLSQGLVDAPHFDGLLDGVA